MPIQFIPLIYSHYYEILLSNFPTKLHDCTNVQVIRQEAKLSLG